jgi:hypothetical protein
VGDGYELVGESQKLVEQGKGRLVAGRKVDGELDALLGDGLVDPVLKLLLVEWL